MAESGGGVAAADPQRRQGGSQERVPGVGRFIRILYRRRWKRLDSEIAVEEKRRGGLLASQCDDTRNTHDEAVQFARDRLNAGDIDAGWNLLLSAQRLRLEALDAAGIEIEIAKVRTEAAQKLKHWRKTAVEQLLAIDETASAVDKTAEPCEKPLQERHQRLIAASEILHQHFANEGHKATLRRGSVTRLSLILVVTLAVILALFWTKLSSAIVEFDGSAEAMNGLTFDSVGRLLVWVAVLGLLGATFSSLTGWTRSSSSQLIPEVDSAFSVNLIRIMSGPAAAIIITLAMLSDLYGLVFNFERPNGYGLLVIAFAAGFSERLVRRLLDALGSDEQPPVGGANGEDHS